MSICSWIGLDFRGSARFHPTNLICLIKLGALRVCASKDYFSEVLAVPGGVYYTILAHLKDFRSLAEY